MADVDRRVSGVTTSSRVEKRTTTTVTKKRTTSDSSDLEVKRIEDKRKPNNYEVNGLKNHGKKYVEVEESSEEEYEDEEEGEEEVEGIKPSVNPNEVAKQFSEVGKEKVMICKICGKYVYQMEKIKAEKNFFHISCFRCKECNKPLTVDSFSSHEGDIYCKLHFKQLFQPKVRFDDDAGPKRPRRHEMIIRENIPAELPPDVVRSNTKVDDFLDNLNLDLDNIKSRFESGDEDRTSHPSHTDMLRLERCDSVMLRLAKYQSAVSGEATNGNASSTDSEDEEDRDPSVYKETRKREKVAFHEMDDLKNQWEKGSVGREDRKEDIRDEVNKIRQRLCLGRSESMKAVYEKACNDAYKGGPRRSDTVNLGRDVKAVAIKQKFEKGDVLDEDIIMEKEEKMRKEKEEDLSVFYDPGTAHTARNLFKQIDATATAAPITSRTKSPSVERSRSRIYSPQTSVSEGDIVRCSEPAEKEEIQVETVEVSQKFKFFENFKEEQKERKRFQITPPREVKKEESPEIELPRDPNIVRECDHYEDLPNTDTAKRMLSKFKALESGEEEESQPAGPKPLKRITPPREFFDKNEKKEPSPEPERDPSIVVSSYKVDDDIVVEADKAKILREKFEKWEAEMKKNNPEEQNEDDEYYPQADTTKNLKAKFEAIKEEVMKPKEKPKPRVRRFI